MNHRFTRLAYIVLIIVALFPSASAVVKSSAMLAIVRMFDPDRYIRLGSKETFKRLNTSIEEIKTLRLKRVTVCYSAREGATSLYHLNALVKSDLHSVVQIKDERACKQHQDISLNGHKCRIKGSECLWWLDARPPQLIQL